MFKYLSLVLLVVMPCLGEARSLSECERLFSEASVFQTVEGHNARPNRNTTLEVGFSDTSRSGLTLIRSHRNTDVTMEEIFGWEVWNTILAASPSSTVNIEKVTVDKVGLPTKYAVEYVHGVNLKKMLESNISFDETKKLWLEYNKICDIFHASPYKKILKSESNSQIVKHGFNFIDETYLVTIIEEDEKFEIPIGIVTSNFVVTPDLKLVLVDPF